MKEKIESVHKTVLLKETIDGLNLQNDSSTKTIVDATFGGGGHSLEICKRYPGVKIIALDQDKSAFEKAKSKFKDLDCDITFVNKNFKDLDTLDSSNNLVDGIIFDLGLSSDQLENSGRGFSFMKDEPLLMTMKENPSSEDLTAFDVVNTWEEKSLADIIYGYGEEKFSRRIAKGIVEAREKKEIKTTFDLVKVISDSVPAVYRRGSLHFATRTFQALRIKVNNELDNFRGTLPIALQLLEKEGRLVVISFHSLEDRIVKDFLREKESKGEIRILTGKPITPKKEEILQSPRARSSKLRAAIKIQ